MLFKPEHKDMILRRSKTATRRIWKSPRVKIGGVYKAKLQMLSKDYFAKIKVEALYKQALGKMKHVDALQEGYESLAEFKKIWIEINGSWNANLIVDVIEFELLEGER